MAVLLLSGVAIGIGYNQGQEVLTKGNLDDGVYFHMVSHTEYKSGETGQIIARLVDWRGDPIDADCLATIKYPDKTSFISNQTMTESSVAGDFYINFTTPSVEGIYEYQSVCNYTIGASPRESRATNSFHLSPALNIISVINSTTLEINGTTHNILDDLRAINQSVDSDLSTIYNDITAINTSIDADLDLIYTDTQYIRDNMLSDEEFTNNITLIDTKLDEISNNLTAIEGFCDDPVTNTSTLCTYVKYIRENIYTANETYQNMVEGYLSEINSTTHSTYDYMTGSLTTTINGINTDVSTLLARTLSIESTVNATATTVNQVNDTVNQIQTNQEEQVYMTVFSG